MNARLRWIAIVAIGCGLIAAAVVAAAVPKHSTRPAPTASPAPGPIVVRPPRGPNYQPGLLALKPDRSTVRIERQLADPLGGPPFALRMFKAERLAPAGRHPTLAHMRLLGHDLCAQLGRIYHGRFGWIDAQNVFRPARFDYRDAPTMCGDRWRDDRSHPEILTTTLISDPTQARASARETIGWGFGGPLVRSVKLENTKTNKPSVSSRGAFLVAAQPYLRAADLHAAFTYRGRPPIGPQRYANPPGEPPSDSRLRVPRTVAGSDAIEARAPDPGGGLAWGVLGFRADTGGFCGTQPGRVVGNRVGSVNFTWGTFDEAPTRVRHCSVSSKFMPPKWPVAIGEMFGSGVDETLDPTLDPGGTRVALRTLPGRTVFYGVARPGVRSVTLESPRDVRTLLPSPRARIFIVVYDGSFPTGQMKLTATMADGSKQTVTQQAGFG